MSIFAYVGLPGAGKSYTVVEHQLLPALRAGRHVVTNLALEREAVEKLFPGAVIDDFSIDAAKADPEKIFQLVPPGCVLILDEVWRLFPAGQKANQVPDPFKRLLAEHRHMVDVQGNSMQIVLVTQDLAQIAAFARQLVEQTFRTVKLTSLGSRKRFRLDVFNGAVSGNSPPLSKRVREIYGRYDPRVYRLYRSHTMSESAVAGANEAAVDTRGNIWRSPIWWVGGAVCVALGWWGVSAAWSALHKSEEPAAAEARTVSVANGRARPPARGASRESELAASRRASSPWRVAGYVVIERRDGSYVLLTDGTQRVRLPFHKACRFRSTDGLVECQFEGETVKEYRAF